MKLSPAQRARLVSYWTFRSKPPTRIDLLKRIAPQIAVFVLLCGISAACAFLSDPVFSRVALVLLGVFLGTAYAAIAHVMMTFHQWPLMEQITDWERVESLKQENAPDAG